MGIFPEKFSMGWCRLRQISVKGHIREIGKGLSVQDVLPRGIRGSRTKLPTVGRS